MASDVLIIGGGVIGLLSAWRLAQAGLRVAVFERGRPASEASAAALGVLWPRANAQRPQAWVDLMQASLKLYPALIDEARMATQVEVEWGGAGVLHTALTDKEFIALQADLPHQQAAGLAVELLTPREAQELEPDISPYITGALLFATARYIDNARLGIALHQAARRLGVHFHLGQTVRALVQEDGRVTGVYVGQEKHTAAWVVLAAGSWSGQLEGFPLPIRPIKGQAIAIEPNAVSLRHVVDSSVGYIVPRRDGRFLVGASVEDVGFDRRNTVGETHALLAGAMRMMPGLHSATFQTMWTGFRPRTTDELPLLGPLKAHPGLILATGHYRNGILLAPITAQLVTGWITGQASALDTAPFAPDRLKDIP